MNRLVTRSLILVVGFLASCRGAPQPLSLRLIDLFDAAKVDQTVPTAELESLEWRFDGEGTITSDPPVFDEGLERPEQDLNSFVGWTAYHDIDNFQVRDERLSGVTGELPLLHVLRPDGLDETDFLHSIEITLSVSEGTRIGVTFNGSEELDDEQLLRNIRRSTVPTLHAELEPGEDVQTYTLQDVARSFPIAGIRHILVQPSDVEGAEFAIESVRIIPRREHLRSVTSGPGWHGLGEIYRETIVSRTPERVSLELELPSEPWFEVAVGTIETNPITFKVEVGETQLWQRTVTLPRRWETKRIDLSGYAGQRVTLSLTLEGPEDGLIGFWGTPVVRNSGVLANMKPRVSSDARRALVDGGASLPQGVIVFLGDTLRRDRLDAYGHSRQTAPELSRLSREGARFSDAISQATWTKVSVPSILSSLYPASTGIVGVPDRLASGALTLAEVFRSAGYATFQTSSVQFSGKLSNLHQGVEVLHERASIDSDALGHSSAKTARTYVDRFLLWLDDHHDVPFFAFIHVFDPHSPFESYPPYDLIWASPTGKEDHEARIAQVAETFGDDIRIGDGNRRGPELFPNRSELEASGVDPDLHVAHQLDWYDGSIRGMDAEVSRLIEGLQERGIGDDTVFAFISDHGEEFLEHGWHWHGNTVYGEMLNVPLMLWWPNVIPSGIVIDETVESIDLMPTLLDLSGLPVPEEAQGRSLLPLMANPEDPASLGWIQRPAISERKRMPSRAERMPDDVDQYSIVWDGWKLVRNVDPPEGRPEFELFDHRTDPLNLDNVAADHPEIVQRLGEQLSERLRFAEARRIVSDDDLAEALSPEEVQRLRRLGYIR